MGDLGEAVETELMSEPETPSSMTLLPYLFIYLENLLTLLPFGVVQIGVAIDFGYLAQRISCGFTPRRETFG